VIEQVQIKKPLDRHYPKFMTSIDGKRKIVQSKEEAATLGKDWFPKRDQALKALEERTNPAVEIGGIKMRKQA
jgi:hypothetical protein